MNASYRIFRATQDHHQAARDIVDAYCDEIDVVVRDTPQAFAKYFADDAGIWLAEATPSHTSPNVAGCVMLRPLTFELHAAEVKRLYVRGEHRGAKLAERLMAALHDYALTQGYKRLYLDSKDDLKAAIRLYERLGYTHCARYNDNPQATVFMCKDIAAASSSHALALV